MAGCSKKQAAPPPQQAPQVVVFTVNPAALPMVADLSGRTNAYQVADVRPQVGGIIQKRLFVEGADVKAGTPLYQIDSATYQASYNSARAALTKAKANLLTSGPKVARYKELVAIEGVSRQEYDDAVATYEQAKADVEAATAALESANINVRYTTVTAPISGRTSRSTVTAGALVTAGQTEALTTVQQLDPIYVDVTQSSTDLLRLKRQLADGSLKKAGDGQAKVNLILPDGSKYSESGKLQFSGVSVEPTTGNVVLRALFPNPKGELLPGMFVRAQLETGIDDKAITVPQVGVSRNQKGEATAMILNKEKQGRATHYHDQRHLRHQLDRDVRPGRRRPRDRGRLAENQAGRASRRRACRSASRPRWRTRRRRRRPCCCTGRICTSRQRPIIQENSNGPFFH